MRAGRERRRGNRADRAAKLSRLLEGALGDVFPAYQACVSVGGEVVHSSAAGDFCSPSVGHSASRRAPHVSLASGSLVDEPGGTRFEVGPESVFDLASMTKAIATVPCCMHLHAAGRLPLDVPLHELLGRPVAGGAAITARRLLTHAAGLPAWRPFHLEVRGEGASRREAILRAARDTRPIAPAGKSAVYSDVGFLQLTALVEHLGGKRLDCVFAEVAPAQGLAFRPLEEAEPDRRVSGFVPTELDEQRGLLAGRVNDENAYAMGGVSGHAGLFGTAAAVERFARTLLDAWHGRPSWIPQETVRAFWTKQGEPRGSTWALGWDTPSRTGSSAGSRPPKDAVGHVGFTGTSIWIAPAREAVAVLLTNRVWPDRSNERIRAFRPLFHDAVWAMA